MSNAEEHDNEIVISVGNPEKIPGNPESYRKMANEFEDASCAIDSLGELIKNVNFDRMEGSLPEGIGAAAMPECYVELPGNREGGLHHPQSIFKDLRVSCGNFGVHRLACSSGTPGWSDVWPPTRFSIEFDS